MCLNSRKTTVETALEKYEKKALKYARKASSRLRLDCELCESIALSKIVKCAELYPLDEKFEYRLIAASRNAFYKICKQKKHSFACGKTPLSLERYPWLDTPIEDSTSVLKEIEISSSEILALLPRTKALLIEMKFIKGMTEQEVALSLGINQSNVSRGISSALEILRNHFGLDAWGTPIRINTNEKAA